MTKRLPRHSMPTSADAAARVDAWVAEVPMLDVNTADIFPDDWQDWPACDGPDADRLDAIGEETVRAFEPGHLPPCAPRLATLETLYRMALAERESAILEQEDRRTRAIEAFTRPEV